MIKTLTKEYIQKSRIFLYPLLDIKRGSEATPLESYVSWDGKFGMQDHKLICVYSLREDEEFKRFEKTNLLAHMYFDSYYELENNKGAYVFNMKEYEHDFSCFIMGKYSEFISTTKEKIISFFKSKPASKEIAMSYLYPERFYDNYAELLAVKASVLKDVGQLCSKPNLDKETLHATVKEVEIFNFI